MTGNNRILFFFFLFNDGTEKGMMITSKTGNRRNKIIFVLETFRFLGVIKPMNGPKNNVTNYNFPES